MKYYEKQTIALSIGVLFFLLVGPRHSLGVSEEDRDSVYNNFNNYSEEQGILNKPNYSLYGSAGTNNSGRSNSSCIGGGDLPSFVPDLLSSYFKAAGEKHNVDSAMIATIYAVENALYTDSSLDSSNWRISKIHSNSWAVSPGNAKGPMQFLDSTWNGHKQEGPYLYESGKWTTNEGPGDGIDVNHADDAIYGAGDFLSSIGAKSGLSLGSAEQDFSRGTDLITIATVLKNYNAGAGTWRDGGVWKYLKNGQVTAWSSTKQTEINGYIDKGLSIYSELSGLSSGGDGGCTLAEDIQFQMFNGELFDHGKTLTSVDSVLLHWTGGLYSGGPSQFQSAIASNKACGAGGCSVQLFADKEGIVWQMVPNLETATWHGCQANYNSIGIEIEGRGESDLLNNEVQKQAVISAVVKLTELFPTIDPQQQDPVNLSGILGHIETDRVGPCKSGKPDPGENYLEEVRSSIRRSIEIGGDKEGDNDE